MPYRFVILVAVLLLNGFFAAAEVALVSVRKSRLRALADEGQAGAQAALNLLANPSRLLSMTQAGVTVASLGLGWAGENTLYDWMLLVFQQWMAPAIRATLARRQFRNCLSADQLRAHSFGRSGAEEPGHRKGRPSGDSRGAAAGGVRPDLTAFHFLRRAVGCGAVPLDWPPGQAIAAAGIRPRS